MGGIGLVETKINEYIAPLVQLACDNGHLGEVNAEELKSYGIIGAIIPCPSCNGKFVWKEGGVSRSRRDLDSRQLLLPGVRWGDFIPGAVR